LIALCCKEKKPIIRPFELKNSLMNTKKEEKFTNKKSEAL
jgi:hypothetical protein